MMAHALTMTYPLVRGECAFRSTCSCGWTGDAHVPAHVCKGDHSDSDTADYWRAKNLAEQAAVEDGSDHIGYL